MNHQRSILYTLKTMKGKTKMIETITAIFTQFIEKIMAPGFDFYDIIAAIITAIGLDIIF